MSLYKQDKLYCEKVKKSNYWGWGRDHLLKGKRRPLSEVICNCIINFPSIWLGSITLKKLQVEFTYYTVPPFPPQPH